MKKIFVYLFAAAIALTMVTQSALAGGDKVRGDESVGPSYQLGDCPFTG